MPIIKLKDLPPPPPEKIGFPWTEMTPTQSDLTKLPTISIITPTLNQGQYIEETIRSVLLQSYPNLEYIIIDGGSTDNTLEIIKKYEKHINYWISEPDSGQSDAINKGLAQATGQVFNWLNSDDFYLPNTLLEVGQYFKNEHINVLCAREIQRTNDGKEHITTGTLICSSLEETIALGINNQPPTFIRLFLVKQLGEIEKELHFCMDAELWTHYLIRFGLENVRKSEKILNIFRIHKSAKSSNLMLVSYRDRFNILVAISKSLKHVRFPLGFINDHSFFQIYLEKRYNIPERINEKKLAAFIAERLIEYYAQYLSWQSVFQLYLFSIRQLPLGRSRRFYFSFFIKLKRLFYSL